GGGAGWRCSASQRRTSSAKARSSVVKPRSTPVSAEFARETASYVVSRANWRETGGSQVPEALAAGGDERVVQRLLVVRGERPVVVVAPTAHPEAVVAGAVRPQLLVDERAL